MHNWPSGRLGVLTTKIGSGVTPRGGKEGYVHTGTALIRSQNVLNDGFSKEGLAYVTDEVAEDMKSVTVEPEDVLLNITGESVARACQVDPAILPARVNQHVLIIRTKADELLPQFLRYVLVHPGMQARLLGLASAGATRQALTKGMIEQLEVPTPPIAEQRAIAAVLGALDDKIELNRRMNRTLEELARAIFRSWFVDFDPVRAKAAGRAPVGMDAATAALFPAGFERSEVGEVPEGWRVQSFGDIALINACTLGVRDEQEIVDYIEISEVMRGEVGNVVRYSRSDAPSRARRRLRHGDTALSTVRPDRGAHFLALRPGEFDVASTGFAVFTPRDERWAFLYSALTQQEVGEELGRLADGGAYPAVRPEVIASIEQAVPGNVAIVEAFERVAQPLYSLADANRRENRLLSATRDYLLPKLLSGEVRVRAALQRELQPFTSQQALEG